MVILRLQQAHTPVSIALLDGFTAFRRMLTVRPQSTQVKPTRAAAGTRCSEPARNLRP